MLKLLNYLLTPQEENLKIKQLEREVKFLKKSLRNIKSVNDRYKLAYNKFLIINMKITFLAFFILFT